MTELSPEQHANSVSRIPCGIQPMLQGFPLLLSTWDSPRAPASEKVNAKMAATRFSVAALLIALSSSLPYWDNRFAYTGKYPIPTTRPHPDQDSRP